MFVVKERIFGIEEHWDTTIEEFEVEADACELEDKMTRAGAFVWVEEVPERVE